MPTTLKQNFEPNPKQMPAVGDPPGTSSNTALEERARQLGSALGRTVAALGKTRTRLQDAATEVTDTAVTQLQGVKQQIKTGYQETKAGAEHILHDYPVHVVLAAAALGVLLGVSLRIWRASHES